MTPAEKTAARCAIHLKEVERLQAALNDYVSDLQAAEPEGKHTRNADWSALHFLECLGFVFDVNAQADMDQIRSELGIDDEGYRLNSDGDRLANAHRWHVPAERLK